MSKDSAQQHVAVFTFPFGTHAAPLLNIVRNLAKAAPDVTFSFFSTGSSNSSLFSSSEPTPSGNIKVYDVDDGVPEACAAGSSHQKTIGFFLKAAPESFQEGVEEAEKDVGRKISCVMSDAFLWFACQMAEEKGVPWVAVWTSGAAAISTHLHTDLIRQTVGLHEASARRDETLTFVPGLSKIKIGDLQSGILFGDLESPLSVTLHRMGQFLPRAHAVVINSFEDLDPTIVRDLKAKLRNLLNIGPLNLASPPPSSTSLDMHGCIPWLDQRNTASAAYIGFGSVVKLPAPELKALAEALEAKKTPFLWSLKDELKCSLPEGFLGRTREYGRIVPWAPQVQVLSHRAVGVFISHCGWNSILESISAGVPIISRPFFGDQQLNAAMIEEVWQVGVRVKGGSFTKDTALQALESVLSGEGMNLKKQMEMFKELALKSIEPNGSSTQNFVILQNLVMGH